MKRKQIEDILILNTVKKALDKNIVNLLLENFGDILVKVKSKQKASKELFEQNFYP